jgi:hypothetical protein
MTESPRRRPRKGSVAEFMHMYEQLKALSPEKWEQLFSQWRVRTGEPFPDEEWFRKFAARDHQYSAGELH